MLKKIGLLVGLAVGAMALTLLLPSDTLQYDLNAKDLETDGIISQKYVSEGEEKEVLTIYYKDQLLGIVHDIDEYEQFLERIYEEKYAEDFPNTEVGLGEDVHVSKTLSQLEVEDKDEEIFAYLEENNFFSIMGYKIEFSNGSIAYVKNSDDFIRAREDFVLNFLESNGVDPSEIKKLLDIHQTTPYSSDERQDISYRYLDSAKISNELVPIDLILKDYDECITWLSFGYSYEPNYYTVEEGDMIQGVASKMGVSVMNLLSVNSETLKSETQLLQVGEELNVTPIDPPVQLEVVKNRIVEETAYPESTQYIYDDTLREGQRIVEQSYKEGTYNVQYQETYVNGELDESQTKEISRLLTEAPQQEIVRIGTMVIPNVGSGSFRLPVDNAYVSCDWLCYYGHTAIDVQNLYNKYGSVKAADRGTIVETGYGPVTGYYVIINHNNGFWTYYGHMSQPCFYSVGTTVAKGEVIGQIGMTGRATGPHVHFEIRNGPYYADTIYPWPYIGG